MKIPVTPSIKYLSQVFPDDGKEAKATTGNFFVLLNLIAKPPQISSFDEKFVSLIDQGYLVLKQEI